MIDNSDLSNYLNQINDLHDDDKYYTIDKINAIKTLDKVDTSILHLNIRSLNKHSTELLAFLTELNLGLDCICLTEVNKTNLDSYSTLLPGYSFNYVAPNSSNVGGVGIYVKEEVGFEILTSLEFSCKDPCENLWVKLTKNRRQTIIGTIYRHPNGNIDDFNSKLEIALQNIENIHHDKCIIVGDINIDLIKYNQQGKSKTKEYLDLLLTQGYLPGTILPSRVTDHTATLIDHIFYKEKKESEKITSGNIFTDITDHFANFIFIFNKKPLKQDKTRKLTRIFGEKNKNVFLDTLRKKNWDDLYMEKDANKCASLFHNFVQRTYNEAFPTKLVSKRKLKDKPWITAALKKCIVKKNALFSTFTRNRTSENKMKYSKYRNILLSCLRSSKNAYFRELFDKKSTRITKMWSTLGSFLNPNKHKIQNALKNIVYEGKLYDSSQGIAEILNTHFCNIGEKVSQKIQSSKNTFSDYLKQPVDQTFYLTPVDELEVSNIIQDMKTKKSPGDDDIRPAIIKLSCSLLVKPITYIYNVSFSSGVMPDIWKIAKVIPIFKKGDKTIPDNYRPISLLSCFEKIMEKLLAKRIHSFISKHKILYKLQFGFREGHSTIHALLELIEKIYSNLDERNCGIGIFLDLSKAFDTIDHSILLHKLSYYGFRGIIHKWFSSYLANRRQYTVVNGIKSQSKLIAKGVPQGSVLGPILFTLFVNDMKTATSLEPRLFADDTNLFNFGKSTEMLINETNIELEKISDWLKANKLLVNTDKTNYSIFHSGSKNNQQTNSPVKLTDELKQYDHVKYLGLIIDQDLSWKNHIHKIKSEIVKYTSIFSKIRYSLPKDCLTAAYDSLVLSKISYGLEAYGVAPQKYLKELQVIQNRILRLLSFKENRYSTNALHKELNFLKINDLYELKILKFMHQINRSQEKLPVVFQNYFLKNESFHVYNTRKIKDYKIHRTNKRWGERMLLNKGARLWNELPESLKDVNKTSTFTKRLKRYFISRY